jgi:hypothetical protein
LKPQGVQVHVSSEAIRKVNGDAQAEATARLGTEPKMRDFSVLGILFTCFAFFLVVTYLMFMFPAESFDRDTASRIGLAVFMLVIVASFVVGFKISTIFEKPSKKRYEEYQQKHKELVAEVVLAKFANPETLKLLWPGYQIRTCAEPSLAPYICTVALPPPPSDSNEMLKKLESSSYKENVYIAVSAATFASQERQSKGAPIVYVTEGCQGAAVAIIAQWGDSAIEQVVIEEFAQSFLA